MPDKTDLLPAVTSASVAAHTQGSRASRFFWREVGEATHQSRSLIFSQNPEAFTDTMAAHDVPFDAPGQVEDFLTAAYLMLLNRLPDLDGLRSYAARLAEGVNPEQILLEIASSAEALQLLSADVSRLASTLDLSRFEFGLIPSGKVAQNSNASDPHEWFCQDNDPQFLITNFAALSHKKIRIKFEIVYARPLISPTKLYWDTGSGLNEAESIRLITNDNKVDQTLSLPGPLTALRLDPSQQVGSFTIKAFEIHVVGPADPIQPQESSYEKYISRMEPAINLNSVADTDWTYLPTFSIVVPVYNVEAKWLKLFIESVRAQTYPHWELCLADDCSSQAHVRPLLEAYAKLDARIRLTFRSKNGHISAATNSALELATGDFMCLMDNDDEIAPQALYEFAAALNRDSSIDMIYSDEDKLDLAGNRYEPFFKPDWSPETLEGCMFTAHFACYRMSIVRKLDGFREGYDGAQDYDFVLRFTELAAKIVHIPKILYHWRAIPGSTADSMDAKDYVLDAALRALSDRATRVGGGGEARLGDYKGSFDVRYKIASNPLVSIVIPSAGRTAVINGREVDLLAQVVTSICQKNTYKNLEIIVVHNGDLRADTLQVLALYGCRLVQFDGVFNIATKMNMGAKVARGEHLLFMNDDIEVINEDWMECMLQMCQRSGIGAVGAKLHFADGTLQHVGVAFCKGLPDHIQREFDRQDPGYFFSAVANRNYLAVTGAVMMTKRAVFEDVGGFDERFAINYNDIDYCLKVFSSGYRIVYVAGAHLYHYESLSRERSVASQEISLFLEKWKNLTMYDPYYSEYFETHAPKFELRSDWPIQLTTEPAYSPVITDSYYTPRIHGSNR